MTRKPYITIDAGALQTLRNEYCAYRKFWMSALTTNNPQYIKIYEDLKLSAWIHWHAANGNYAQYRQWVTQTLLDAKLLNTLLVILTAPLAVGDMVYVVSAGNSRKGMIVSVYPHTIDRIPSYCIEYSDNATRAYISTNSQFYQVRKTS